MDIFSDKGGMFVAELKQDIVQISKLTKDRTELWGRVIEQYDFKTICEIGVYEGEFASNILRMAKGIEKYYLIDPWKHLSQWNKPANKSDATFERIYEKAMQSLDEFRYKTVVLREESINAIRKIENESLDFVYIDGDHTLRGITIDLIQILPKVKRGGLIAGDDFAKNIWQHGLEYSPSEVFPFAIHFAEAHGLPITTLPWNQFCICNSPEIGFRVIDLEGYSDLEPTEIYRYKPNRWRFF